MERGIVDTFNIYHSLCMCTDTRNYLIDRGWNTIVVLLYHSGGNIKIIIALFTTYSPFYRLPALPYHLFFLLFRRVTLNLLLIIAVDSLGQVNRRLGKVSGRDFSLKQNIQLSRRPILGLRNTKVRENNGNETTTSPKQACLGTPVPSSRVELIRSENTGNDGSNSVCPAGEDDRLAAEQGRGDLGAERVGQGSDGAVVEERGDDEEGADGPGEGGRGGTGLRDAEGADEDHDDEHEDETPEVDCAAAEEGEQNPLLFLKDGG